MLLIDGVEYDLQTPANEDEFERVVEEHAQDIFGLNAIYVTRKQRLRSFSGVASIPDGYAIDVDADRWHVVEVELSSHPLHEHIISQLSRFINGIKNPSTQRQIVAAIYEEIEKNSGIRECLEASLESKEIYKYLSDLIAEPPILTIVIDNSTQELKEAVASLAHPEIKIVEFRTFFRARVGPGGRLEGSAEHVHLFEPLYEPAISVEPEFPPPSKNTVEVQVREIDIKYRGIYVPKEGWGLFPNSHTKIELQTTDGKVFQRTFDPRYHFLALGESFSKYKVKAVDRVRITPITPKEKYSVEFLRGQRVLITFA